MLSVLRRPSRPYTLMPILRCGWSEAGCHVAARVVGNSRYNIVLYDPRDNPGHTIFLA